MKIIGVCAGNGVMLHTFKNKDIVANIEPRRVFHTKLLEQWKLNFGNTPYFKSLNDYKEAKELPSSINYLIGAPDCGHSSILSYSRAKKTHDPKDNISIAQYISSVEYFKPEVFLMENLIKFKETGTYQDMIELLSDQYRFITHEGSVKEFGNSQVNRIRLILIGIRKDQNKEADNIFGELKTSKVLKTSRQLELDAKECPDFNYREDPEHSVPMSFEGKKLNLKEVKKIWRSKYHGQKRWAMPGTRMKNLPGVYRNMADCYPMTARKETRQFDSRGNALSPRQLATIQGLPGSFKIHYDKDNWNYWLNKARVTVTKCPPYEIALWFKKKINNYEDFKKISN